ncbi:MAG: DoxX family protein [Bacteroidetes bacterium]|nr:DoxX family protein [Bacteroidota bacterium]
MKKFFIYLMAVFYICAGINHFWHPADYIKIMPPYLSYQSELVFISGVFEILCGILLILPKTRRIGAWLTILLLIAVFPANIQMTINYYNEHNPDLWISIIRLPIQLILLWWAWLYTKTPLSKVS